MANHTIAIMGTSYEFATNHLINELCTLEKFQVIIYDVNAKSELGVYGKSLSTQASFIHPGVTIRCTSELSEVLCSDYIIWWGLTFPPGKVYNSAYKEFFTGKFKLEVEKILKVQEGFKPQILFLHSNGRGLVSANILCREIPAIKKNVFVLSGLTDACGVKLYPRTVDRPMEIEPMSVAKRKAVTLVIDAAGQMLDVDTLITCIKGVHFESQSPPDMFSFVGLVPCEAEKTRFKLEGSVCMFMPKPGSDQNDLDMEKLLMAEEKSINDFLE